MTKPRVTLPRLASTAGGAALAAATGVVASLRPARKPLHPRGDVLTGRIFRSGSEEKTGVAWLDEPGEDDAVVRLSRAIGLPRTLPDIHGLGIRVAGEAGEGDLLFATTGWGHLTRFVLTLSRRPRTRPMTTLLPYETDTGPVLLGADGIGAETYELAWARPAGEWHAFGVLRLSSSRAPDADISFDPVRRQLTGLRQYAAVERLREPAYLRARRSRSDV
ncbi:MAG: putative phosphodiesterase [Nocardioides sp.]|nr:putative phosphodiesterase [Nocardioides sp.]